MPLNTPEDYERLGEHLTGIDTDLANFANEYGYTLYPPLSGGRYPNRRITHEGPVMRTIHISMDDAENGERFDQFFPDIPYTICGMAWIDYHEQLKRRHAPKMFFSRLPFSMLTQTLRVHLDHFHGYVSGISEAYIKTCALTSQLRS